MFKTWEKSQEFQRHPIYCLTDGVTLIYRLIVDLSGLFRLLIKTYPLVHISIIYYWRSRAGIPYASMIVIAEWIKIDTNKTHIIYKECFQIRVSHIFI